MWSQLYQLAPPLAEPANLVVTARMGERGGPAEALPDVLRQMRVAAEGDRNVQAAGDL